MPGKNTDSTIKINFTGNASNFINSINEMQKALNSLDLTKTAEADLNKTFARIREEIDKLNGYIGNNELRFADAKDVSATFEKIEKLYNQLLNKIGQKNVFGAGLKQDEKGLKLLKKVQDDYNASLKELQKLQKSQQKEFNRENEKTHRTIKAINEDLKNEKRHLTEIKKAQQEYNKGNKGDLEIQKLRNKALERAKSGEKYKDVTATNIDEKVTSTSFGQTKEGKALKDALKAREEINKSIDESEKKISALNAEAEKTRGFYKLRDDLKLTGKQITDLKNNKVRELIQELEKGDNVDFDVIKSIASEITDIDKLTEAIQDFENGTTQAAEVVKNNLKEATDGATDSMQGLSGASKSANEEIGNITARQKEIDNLKQRLTAFFGIDNAVRLFRRALQSSFNTIKELDQAMTEMAVVTKLDVSDYWDQLPTYTQRANDLGIATKAAYEAATLYYQQGLKSQQVMELSIPTLRMARIAGLEAAEATDRMTNALRGFNMELNETNANRVADVYSKLAAITASNVDEISTAMTKTASIASNAGMAFETTAAFLAQIIETTRESAETAGTALKTVIARFQELKKDPSLIGEVDGEVVDANKIETALRTVGVALRDSAGQFRNLDEVFLELAQKWDTLDVNTQRYIATIAAGSRQQSRFIAMMSNYQHTVELVNAANTSAGASVEQFNKTLESLESKLARLKNAWDQFTMGLANSDVVKGAVDVTTWLINGINTLTKGWDNASSSILKFVFALTALKAGRVIFGGLAGATKRATKEESSFVASLIAQTAVQKANFAENVKSLFQKGLWTIGTYNQDKATEDLNRSLLVQKGILQLNNGQLVLSMANLVKYVPHVLAVVAAITTLILVFKALKAASPEGQLEKAKEATQKAAEAAERAASAYSGLNDALDSLRDKYNNINELTKGTTEWYDAIQEANSGVLSLINNYPELAKLMTSTADGLLSIDLDSADVQKVLKGYQEDVINAQLAESRRRINQQQAQDRVDAKELSKQLGFSETLTAKVASAFASGELNAGNARSWAENNQIVTVDNYNSFTKSIEEATDALIKFTEKMQASDNTTSGFYRAMVTTAYNAVDQKRFTSEQLKQMQSFATTDYMAGLVANSTSIARIGLETDEAAVAKAMLNYAKTYYSGLDYKISGQTITYTDDTGTKRKERVSIEDLAENEGNINAQSKLTKVLEKVPAAVRALEVGFGTTAARNLFSAQEGRNLTKADIKAIEDANLEDLYNQKEAIGEIYGTFKEFNDKIVSDINLAKEAYDVAEKSLEFFNIELRDELTANVQKALAEKFELVFRESGIEGVNAVSKPIYDIIDELGEQSWDKAQQFASALAATEWTSEDAVRDLSKLIEELGLSSLISSDKVNELEQKINDFANSVNEFNLDGLNTKLETFGSMIDKVLGNINDNTKTYSREERNKLIDKELASYSDFISTGIDEYTYIGNQNTLLEKIYEATSDILSEVKSDLHKEILSGERFNAAIETYGKDNVQLAEEGLGETSIITAIAGLADSSYTPGMIGDTALKEIARKVLDWTAGDIEKATGEMLSQALIKAYNQGISVEANRANLESYNRDEDVLNYAILNSGQEITNKSFADAASAEKALDGLIAKNLGYKTAQDQVKSSIEKTNKAIAENSILIKAHAKDSQDARASFEKVRDSVNDYVTALDEGRDGYAEFEALQNTFIRTFGEAARDTITYDFVNENTDLFRQMMDDDVAIAQEGFDKIRDIIKKDFVSSQEFADLKDDFAEEFHKIEEMMPIEGTADFTGIMDAIAATYSYGSEQFEKLKEKLQEIFNVRINYQATDVKIRSDDINAIEGWLERGYKVDTEKGVEGGYITLRKSDAVATTVGEFGTPTTKDAAKTLENQYDWLYNLTSHIAQKTAEKAREEKRYALLLKNEGSSMEAITASYEAQEAALRSQAIMQEKMVQSRESELNWIMAQYADVGGYATWKDGRVNIDWQKIEGVKNSGNEALMERIDEYISQLEHADDERTSALDALLDIETTLQSMREQLTQAYLSMEKRIQDAIIYDRQSAIDRQQDVLDSVDNANNDLINCINKNISKLRQDRENDKTERNISTLEQRRAYLIASGASAKEIKQIDEQLNEAKESYTDTLIDQAITNLEEYNTEAVAQRQRLIDLQQAQLEWDKENGVIASQAYEKLISLKTTKYGVLDISDPETAETARILENAEGVKAMSLAGAVEWKNNLVNAIHEALLAYNEGAVADDKRDYEQEMINKFAETGRIDDNILTWNRLRNDKIDRLGYDESWKISNEDLEGYLRNKTGVGINGFGAKGAVPPEQTDALNHNTATQQTAAELKLEVNKHAQIKDTATNFGSLSGGKNIASFLKNSVGLIKDIRDNQAAFYLTDEKGNPIGFTGWIKVDDLKPLAYEQGGLANFTGPAWLDGTRSKPEIVLNAEDTANFIQLRDILRNLLPGITNTNSIGDAYYNFEINVDQVASDYDIERVADTVKTIINRDGAYRNVNSISRVR